MLAGFMLVRRHRPFDDIGIIVGVRYFQIPFLDIKPRRRQTAPFILYRFLHEKVSEIGIFKDHNSSLRLGIFRSFAEVIGGVNPRAELVVRI
jgi:hypothetical protein